jgi:putative hydrolase of the HAD superfamily
MPPSLTSPASAVRAVICDIYGTLLHVAPPPPNSEERWLNGCREIIRHTLSLTEFNTRCAEAVASQHITRHAEGESFPEVDWLAAVRTALPVPVDSESAVLISNLHAACSRTCTAMPGALTALESLHRAGILLGIASNAQHYTRDELIHAGFHWSSFHPDLLFLSGEHGFAKPSPRVFAFLTQKLSALGIQPHETLMAGDSTEKDISPARTANWQTWLIGGEPGGAWEQLMNDHF